MRWLNLERQKYFHGNRRRLSWKNESARGFLFLAFCPISASGIAVRTSDGGCRERDLIFARTHTVATCQRPSGCGTPKLWNFQSTEKVYRHNFFFQARGTQMTRWIIWERGSQTCHFMLVSSQISLTHIRETFILVYRIPDAELNEFFLDEETFRT